MCFFFLSINNHHVLGTSAFSLVPSYSQSDVFLEFTEAALELVSVSLKRCLPISSFTSTRNREANHPQIYVSMLCIGHIPFSSPLHTESWDRKDPSTVAFVAWGKKGHISWQQNVTALLCHCDVIDFQMQP